MKPLEEPLRKRQDKGRFWWELRSCAYWDAFEKPKIFYQEIQFHPSYSLDSAGRFGNNKTFFLAAMICSSWRPEFAADVVAQLAVPAAHEGRGAFPRRLPHGEHSHRLANR